MPAPPSNRADLVERAGPHGRSIRCILGEKGYLAADALAGRWAHAWNAQCLARGVPLPQPPRRVQSSPATAVRGRGQRRLDQSCDKDAPFEDADAPNDRDPNPRPSVHALRQLLDVVALGPRSRGALTAAAEDAEHTSRLADNWFTDLAAR